MSSLQLRGGLRQGSHRLHALACELLSLTGVCLKLVSESMQKSCVKPKESAPSSQNHRAAAPCTGQALVSLARPPARLNNMLTLTGNFADLATWSDLGSSEQGVVKPPCPSSRSALQVLQLPRNHRVLIHAARFCPRMLLPPHFVAVWWRCIICPTSLPKFCGGPFCP